MHHDLKSALRQLRRHRLYALTVVLTLGLGIGANTAIFTLVYGLLLRPLPYDRDEGLVRVRQVAPGFDSDDVPFSVPELADFRDGLHRHVDMAEFHAMTFTLLDAGEPERVRTAVVSANFLEVLGVKPVLGRGLQPADEQPGADLVLLLDHGYWRRRFGGDRSVIGRRVEMNDRLLTIVGVLPPLPPYPEPVDIYVPTNACPFRSAPRFVENRSARQMSALVRLGSGVELAAVQAELAGVARRLRQELPQVYPSGSGYDVDLTPVREDLVRGPRRTLVLLLLSVGLVLVIACANVGNLSLAKLLRRQGEFALRAILGARRGGIVGLVLFECLVLALAGGLVGAALAFLSGDLLAAFAGHLAARPGAASVNLPVLLFTFGVSVAAGILFGLVPALWAAQGDLGVALRSATTRTAGGGARWLRNGLVVAQVAVSFSLLVVTGLTLRSLLRLQGVDLGFTGKDVLALEVPLSFEQYREPEARAGFQSRLVPRVEALPGVVAASFSSDAVIQSTPGLSAIVPEGWQAGGTDDLAPVARLRRVGPSYFEVTKTPVMTGRTFEVSDDLGAPRVAVVSRALGERLWPGVEPEGRRLRFESRPSQWLTVVGVVGDVRAGPGQAPSEDLYVPYAQEPVLNTHLLVRTLGPPLSLASRVRSVIREIDPEQPIGEVTTLEQLRAQSIASPRLTAGLLSLFGLVALGIAATGIGAAVAFSVGERRREIGIRMAVGAGRGDVLRMVTRQGMTLVGTGLALGVALSFGVGRSVESVLYGVSPADLPTFVATAFVLAGVAALACVTPARRAAALDPTAVLRTE